MIAVTTVPGCGIQAAVEWSWVGVVRSLGELRPGRAVARITGWSCVCRAARVAAQPGEQLPPSDTVHHIGTGTFGANRIDLKIFSF